MAPTNVGYSFKEAISHFFRNWTTSLGAVITIFLSLFIIGLFIMMFYYSWQLSIILIVLAPIVSIAIRVVSKRFRNISKNMQNTMGQVTTSAEQMLKGHKIGRAHV